MSILCRGGLAATLVSLVLIAAWPAVAAEPIQERTITEDAPAKAAGAVSAAADKGAATVKKGASDASSGVSGAVDSAAAKADQTAQAVKKSAANTQSSVSKSADQVSDQADKTVKQAKKAAADAVPAETPSSSTPGTTGQDIFTMADQEKTYGKNEIEREVMGFFEGGSQGLASLIAKCFNDLGRPVGYIKGEEGAGALVVGLRYGGGMLKLKSGATKQVYWQSPSIGFDLGANASKVFTLVYNLDNIEEIFQRFPGVDGSAYVIGGFGMNYQQSGRIVLAPIRFGVGLRLGANVGYMVYTKDRTINPF